MILLEKFLDALQWVAERIIILAFAVMVLAILATVFTRNISISITWFEELARFMQIWFVGLGFAVALRAGMLSGAEIMLRLLPRRVAKIAVNTAKFLILVISVMVLLSGWTLLAHITDSGQVSSNLQIPMTWVYLGLWLGFGLTAVFVAGSLVLEIGGRKDLLARRFASAAAPLSASEMDAQAGQILAEVSSGEVASGKAPVREDRK